MFAAFLCLYSFLAIASPSICGKLEPNDLRRFLVEEPLAHLQQLGRISDDESGLTRTYLSSAHRQSAQQILKWMEDAGMQSWVDAIGNIHGRAGGDTENAAVLLGSHYDTVVDGGKFDGALGIIVAIAAVKALMSQGVQPAFRRPVEVIAFSDEEGVRFGSTFLGSRAVTGNLVSPEQLAVQDSSGVSLLQALQRLEPGTDAEALRMLAYDPAAVDRYVEVHIEQGPVLEAMGLPLGVVSGIVGETRFDVSMHGTQGHAGTVPMQLRKDALAASAECIAGIEQICGGGHYGTSAAAEDTSSDVVCTVGSINVRPGASNVISGAVNFTVDIRSMSDTKRLEVVRQAQDLIAGIALRREMLSIVTPKLDEATIACDGELMHALAKACQSRSQVMQDMGIRLPSTGTAADGTGGQGAVPVLASGAGHDAVAMASFTKVGMIFVRSIGGVSHSPLEVTKNDDVVAATTALYQYLREAVL